MNGCVYQTAEGRCEKFSNGVSQSFCVGKDAPCGYRKQSNADRIRQMTDEELASLSICAEITIRSENYKCPDVDSCYECRIAWLKQEAEE